MVVKESRYDVLVQKTQLVLVAEGECARSVTEYARFVTEYARAEKGCARFVIEYARVDIGCVRLDIKYAIVDCALFEIECCRYYGCLR